MSGNERVFLKLVVPRAVEVTLSPDGGTPLTTMLEVPVVYSMDGLVAQHAWLRQGADEARGEWAKARRVGVAENEWPPDLTEREKALVSAAERIAFVNGRVVGMDNAVEYLLGANNALAFNSASYQELVRRRREGSPVQEASVFLHYAKR